MGEKLVRFVHPSLLQIVRNRERAPLESLVALLQELQVAAATNAESFVGEATLVDQLGPAQRVDGHDGAHVGEEHLEHGVQWRQLPPGPHGYGLHQQVGV